MTISDSVRAFDPEGARLVTRLLEGGLEERARERLGALEAALAAATVELEDVRRRLRDAGASEPREVGCAVAEGDLRHARRLAERALADHERAQASAASRRARSLADRARERSLDLAPVGSPGTELEFAL